MHSRPTMDVKQLQSFLDIINVNQPFVLHISHHTTLLMEVLKENDTFAWDEASNQAFEWLKTLMATASQKLLRSYNHSKTISIQTCASSRGLNACLLKGGRPLPSPQSPSQTQYVNIEG